jgi:hypothetical protein
MSNLTMTTAAGPDPLSVGTAARRLGVKPWMVRRIYERNLLPAPARIGQYRIIYAGDLPRLKEALRRAGYLR